jgi:hypothetical protein
MTLTKLTLIVVGLAVLLIGCLPQAVPSATPNTTPDIPSSVLPTASPAISSSSLPTLPTGKIFDCVPPPTPPPRTFDRTPIALPNPRIVDETGLVVSCGQTDYLIPHSGPISVGNPFSDSVLTVVWTHAACDAEIVFTFRSGGDRYVLIGQRPSDCSYSGSPLPLQITFTQPMLAENVNAVLLEPLASPPRSLPLPSACATLLPSAGGPTATTTGEPFPVPSRGC